MKFYQKLRKVMENKLSENELKKLPRSYQIIGKILLIKLKPELLKHKKLIGRKILEILPYVHSVFLIKEISGRTRKPQIEFLAGCKNTQTLHKEHNCKFLLDVRKFMWSKGNKSEKIRMVKFVKQKEVIIDMFAGIGYWTIPLAKLTKVKRIYAIDINSEAIEYLEKNVIMNGVEEKVEILKGDCRGFSKFLKDTADRIIMGYLFETEKFLPYALEMAKRKCTIHLHRNAKNQEIETIRRNIEEACKKNKVKVKITSVKKTKSYAPKVWHVVFDLKVKKYENR